MSGPIALFNEAYNVTLVFESGFHTKIDYLGFDAITGTEAVTWGGIKRIFED